MTRALILLIALAGCMPSIGAGTGKDAGPPADTPADAVIDRGAAPELPDIADLRAPETAWLCVPGAATCVDETTREVCSPEGDKLWQLPCGEGALCDLGLCLEQICVPGAPAGCAGPSTRFICSELGTRRDADLCPTGHKCFEGVCVDWACLPGQRICEGFDAVKECVEDGFGGWAWEPAETCYGGICKEGACIYGACEVDPKLNTYVGCDYWAADLDNIEGGQWERVALVVSVPLGAGDAEVTVTDWSQEPPAPLSAMALSVADLVVEEGGLEVFLLPTDHDIDGSAISHRSFRVESSAPVTVHQFNPLNGDGVFTNDASLLLPSPALGQEYLVMSWPQRTYGLEIRGFLTVVATEEEPTAVQIWPTAPVTPGPGVPVMDPRVDAPWEFVLSRGEVLNLETGGGEGADLTGTRIVSDRNVVVFGGHECANIPAGNNYCDHIEQQLYPVAAWGTRTIGDAFAKRSAAQVDTWRILAGADGVQVTLTPPVADLPGTLDRGDFIEFETAESFVADATGPVLVGHFLQGSNYPGFSPSCGTTGIGDPAFTLGVPVGQYLNKYIFLTPEHYDEDYVNIVHPPDAVITIDGWSLEDIVLPIGTHDLGDHIVLQVQIPDGVHVITGDVPFGVTVYGYDCDVSYAYPGGLSLKAIR
jgi:hypothetical protein